MGTPEKCLCTGNENPHKIHMVERTWCETCGYIYTRDKFLTGSRAVIKINGKELPLVECDYTVNYEPIKIKD